MQCLAPVLVYTFFDGHASALLAAKKLSAVCFEGLYCSSYCFGG